MKGLWLDKTIRLRDDLEMPAVAPDEALLAVKLAGVCGTDLEMMKGYADFVGIPGHEFVATVVEGPRSLQGERVVADINVTCGACLNCQDQREHHCLNRSVLGIRDLGGAFAEYVSLPVSNLVRVPERLSDELAVLMEPLAAALEILEQVKIDGAERVLIVGAGRLSQLIVRVLVDVGATVDVLIRSPSRIPMFSQIGVTCVQEAGKQYDVVVECSGSPNGFDIAVDSVRARGTIVLKSTYVDPLSVDASRIVVSEINLVGSRCGPMAQAIDWAVRNVNQLECLTFETYPVEDYRAAFNMATALPGPYKVLFSPGSN